MPEIHVIATDIDYTLTDAELRLDTTAVEKIRELEARGVRVILISGRNLPGNGIARTADRHIWICCGRERRRDR